jgi:hypothetical protein
VFLAQNLSAVLGLYETVEFFPFRQLKLLILVCELVEQVDLTEIIGMSEYLVAKDLLETSGRCRSNFSIFYKDRVVGLV